MLVLEAAAALWFWVQAVSLLSAPSVQPPFLKAVYVAEEAWHSGERAWLDEAEGFRVSGEFRKKTGCCVAFLLEDDGSACLSNARIVHRKVLFDGGPRSGFVVAGCG